MNYMKQVAEMLGVEIGEEFILRNPVNNYTFDKLTYQIDEKGLLEKSKERATRCDTNYTFVKILRGEFEIVKLPKPILDKEEKKYLSRIIRPWKNEVEYIRKISDANVEYILIIYGNHGTRSYNRYDFCKCQWYGRRNQCDPCQWTTRN